jgi:hypothetical protein
VKTSILRSLAVAVPLVALAACSSTPAAESEHPDSSGEPTAENGSPAETSSPDATANTASEASTSSPAASASSAPSAPSGPEEVAKDANALVLDISVEPAKGSLDPAAADKMRAALVAKIATSPKLAVPTSKGVTGNRHVTTRLIVDPLVEEKGKLSEKVQLNGVTTDGHCPLFDLNAKAVLETTKKMDAGDAEAVRVAAVEQVYAKLEAEAATLKPHGACTPEKGKK